MTDSKEPIEIEDGKEVRGHIGEMESVSKDKKKAVLFGSLEETEKRWQDEDNYKLLLQFSKDAIEAIRHLPKVTLERTIGNEDAILIIQAELNQYGKKQKEADDGKI